jgi:hypothetical protein
MLKLAPLLIAAFGVAACQASSAEQSASASEEMEQLKTWLRQLKADDPDTARLLVRECAGEGSLFTDEGKLVMARCMRRKYDEGDRGTRVGWSRE